MASNGLVGVVGSDLRGTTTPRPTPALVGPLLNVHNLRAKYRGATTHAINDVSFTLRPGELMAIIGPSGASKSTLCHALLGQVKDTTGRIEFAGRCYRSGLPTTAVSFVPQSDHLPSNLTVRQTLSYTARLRLPAKTTAANRKNRINRLLDQLDLRQYQDVDVAKLSVGTRKRLSVAAELLSDPLLLILDEPTSGLDEGLDRTLMTLLKDLGDAGPAIIVVTHSTANLDLVDWVLALRIGGTTGYFGPPRGVLPAFNSTHYAEVMAQLAANRATEPLTCTHPQVQASPWQPTKKVRTKAQLPTLIAREQRRFVPNSTGGIVRQLLNLLIHLLVIPSLVIALAAWASPHGFSPPEPGAANRLGILLSTYVVTMAFFGAALTFGEVARDSAAIVRERRWGVRPVSVLLAKFWVYGWVAMTQGALVAAGLVWLRPVPPDLEQLPGSVVLGITTMLLSGSAAALGLLISCISHRIERVGVVLMVACAGQVVLSGLLVPLAATQHTVTAVMNGIAQALPTRWAVGALANLTDYNTQFPHQEDAFWSPGILELAIAWGALGGLTMGYLVLATCYLAVHARRRV